MRIIKIHFFFSLIFSSAVFAADSGDAYSAARETEGLSVETAEFEEYSDLEKHVAALDFSSDGRTLASTVLRHSALHDVETGKIVAQYPEGDDNDNIIFGPGFEGCVCFHPEGNAYATVVRPGIGLKGRYVLIRDRRSKDEQRVEIDKNAKTSTTGISYSTNGLSLYLGDHETTARVYDVRFSRTVLYLLKSKLEWPEDFWPHVRDISQKPGGKIAVIYSWGDAEIFDTRSRDDDGVVFPKGQVDGKTWAVSRDGCTRICRKKKHYYHQCCVDSKGGQEVLLENTYSVPSEMDPVCVTSEMVAKSDSGATLCLWNARTGKPYCESQEVLFHSDSIAGHARQVAVGGYRGQIQLYRVGDTEEESSAASTDAGTAGLKEDDV